MRGFGVFPDCNAARGPSPCDDTGSRGTCAGSRGSRRGRPGSCSGGSNVPGLNAVDGRAPDGQR